MAVAQAPIFDFGIRQDMHLDNLRPHWLYVTQSGANSGNSVTPKRKRFCDPGQYGHGTPCTDRVSAQRGRVWLHRSDEAPYSVTVEPYANYWIHLKTGVFHRFNRFHLGDGFSERFGNLYGFGECRAKELNGQIDMGDFVAYPSIPAGVKITQVDSSDVETGCTIADHGSDTSYRTCQSTGLDGYRVGQDGSDVTWDTYIRVKVDIPAGATILEARMSTYSSGDHDGDGATCRLRLLDDDDVESFLTTEGHTYTQLNPFTTDPELVLTSLGISRPNEFEEDFSELLQAFIDRPGYSEGNTMGVAFMEESNSTGDVFYFAKPANVPHLRFVVRYAEVGADPNAPPELPPVWSGYERILSSRKLDTVTDTEMNEAPGGGINQEVWDNIGAWQAAAEFRYAWFAPVPDIDEWYDPDDHGPTPLYGPDAHNTPFVFNDCGTYPEPCIRYRSSPWAYGTPGQHGDWIKGGLRMAVARAHAISKAGTEPIYHTGCTGEEGSTFGLQENIIHRYEGQTQQVRYTYSFVNDWWIEYIIYIKAWLVYGDERDFMLMAYGSDPDSYGPYEHWNCWYEMQIEAKWRAPDKNTQLAEYNNFVAWVNEKENGFGGTVQPKTQDQCNDVLARCGGVECALGDRQRPDQATQDDCEDTIITNQQLECTELGIDGSWWYLPTLGSNHPYTPSGGPVIPQRPETGLFNEFERVVYTSPEQTTTRTDHGWMQVGFQTNHPIISGETGFDTLPKNQIDDFYPFEPTGAKQVPEVNSSRLDLKWTDLDNLLGLGTIDYFITFIFPNLTAAQVQTQFEAVFGVGNVLVSVKSGTPGTTPMVYTIEFTGDLAGTNVGMFEESFYETYDPDFPFGLLEEWQWSMTRVQNGSEGGI